MKTLGFVSYACLAATFAAVAAGDVSLALPQLSFVNTNSYLLRATLICTTWS